MSQKKINRCAAYAKLKLLSDDFTLPQFHLRHLISEKNRLADCSLKIPGFFYDFSRQQITKPVSNALAELAEQTEAMAIFSAMHNGEKINNTEHRAVLHTAMRDASNRQLLVDGQDVFSLIRKVNEKVKKFSSAIHSKKITAKNSQAFTDAVVIGIGGSYLGCRFVYESMKNSMNPIVRLHFLSNVDIDNFGKIINEINPETCLWIVVSKSYTTTETMANLNQVKCFLSEKGIAVSDHLVCITAKGSPGDIQDNRSALASFHMFDFIGGRYSVTSSVGGVPLSLAFGYEVFEQFLAGCNKMDLHALNSPPSLNIPLTAALLGIWNSNFLKYTSQAIIPYCSALQKLAPHIQQLYMESLGKGVTTGGIDIDYPTGVVIFGEPGTNAQHSFFQLAHQGMPFPVEFIGVLEPAFKGKTAMSKEVTNHQELWANMIAQAKALAIGKEHENPARKFAGNRPSSTIVIQRLDPESIGMLLAFYEARTVFEGFILGINPFDQFGVELGKVLATDIRNKIAEKNRNRESDPDFSDPITEFYVNTLFKKEI